MRDLSYFRDIKLFLSFNFQFTGEVSLPLLLIWCFFSGVPGRDLSCLGVITSLVAFLTPAVKNSPRVSLYLSVDMTSGSWYFESTSRRAEDGFFVRMPGLKYKCGQNKTC